MALISWVILGLIVGLIAQRLMPGQQQRSSLVMTVILGIAGALVGGYVSTLLSLGTMDSFSLRGMLFSVLGAMLLLFIFRKLKS